MQRDRQHVGPLVEDALRAVAVVDVDVDDGDAAEPRRHVPGGDGDVVEKAEAARHVGVQQGLQVGSVLSTLAISIAVGDPSSERGPREIPYSVVTAIDPPALAISRLMLVNGSAVGRLEPGEILLNSWASNDLGISDERDVTLSFFVTAEFGQLETRQAGFRLRGVADLSGAADAA